ncbi:MULTISPECIES: S8 family serine peptidase [Actinosynnema]|uniref:S8 family serine peptidase n=1 Tax=Actinosynnema TaxID=40566 RepID=UPI0020A23BBB|nr:S8 family serine peptidase [Actinosynnema pretiosum]MCP2096309.1 Subtilase family protein [Actinosynnema pretiosum]
MAVQRRKRGALAVVAALIASGTGVASASPTTDDPLPEGGAEVTLITGDRVTVHDGHRPGTITGGPGRERVAFRTVSANGRLSVIPADAERGLAEGRLDPRLFDVTTLVESGYGDTAELPLILTRADGARPALSTVDTTAELPVIDSFAATSDKSPAAFRALLDEPGITKVWLDGKREPALDRSTAQIGAPAAWQAGLTGAGVVVAVLDTGVDETHPDLVGRQLAEADFTEDPDNTDEDGHGTHVASTIASGDATHRGVAPGALILDGKVCGRDGCAESGILAGMQWAVEQGADVVNMSLGGRDTPETDPLEEALTTLSERSGALFVVAAGNDGADRSVGSPGSADAALTVGAVDRDGAVAPFSSRGPRVGDGAVKPDVTAPGVGVVAAHASTSGRPGQNGRLTLSGTSMATPHVAGAAALLKQQHPEWTGQRVKAALVASADPTGGAPLFARGAGRVDLARAIGQTLTTEPSSLPLGLQRWPHDDDVPVARELTYRNAGDRELVLDLSVVGEALPAGLITVSPGRITVPAGGTATATVTGDTSVDAVDGAHGGLVVARSGDAVALRTPVAIEREVESHEVTLKALDVDGKPTADGLVTLQNVVTGESRGLFPAEGGATVRLPAGEYLAIGGFDRPQGGFAHVLRPSLRVSGPTEAVFDASTAKPVEISAPDPDAEELLGQFSVTRTYEGHALGTGYAYLGGFAGLVSIGHAGPEAPDARVLVASQFQGAAGPGGARTGYRLSWEHEGRAPDGVREAPALEELATVRTSYGPLADGVTPQRSVQPAAGGQSVGWGVYVDADRSSGGVDHVNDDTDWALGVIASEPGGAGFELSSAVRRFEAGREYRHRFGFPVFAPTPSTGSPLLQRSGDVLTARVPLFGDGDGNHGVDWEAEGGTRLFRDGVQVGASDQGGHGRFTVPEGEADYQLVTGARRTTALTGFTTAVELSWTFRSGRVDGVRELPVTVVGFSPELDGSGAAAGGSELGVPVAPRRSGGAAVEVTGLVVEVSFDDGGAWAQAPVVDGVARVVNPDVDGFASLRVRGEAGGAGFEQTVLRAYRITA